MRRLSICLICVLSTSACGLPEWAFPIDPAGPTGSTPPSSESTATFSPTTSDSTTPPPSCGDAVCDAHELCATCPDDCGTCPDGPPTLLRGPYLQRGSSSAMVVRWRTEDPTPSAVVVGETPDAMTTVVRSDEMTTEHIVEVTGLRPATTYHYAVGAPDSELVGLDDLSFTLSTHPPVGTEGPTRVWVIGDSGTANRDAEDVRDAYLAFTGIRGTDVWLMLGDNAYDDGTDDEYQRAVFETYPSLLRSTVLWPTIGNHDGHSANANEQSGPYFDIFTLPTAAEAGGTASGTEAYYSFDYANIHFVCLDSLDSSVDLDDDMMTWLQNDLMATSQPWLVAYWHHPPYTKGSHDSDDESSLEKMREDVLPVLESHGVDLVLAGHSHSYERSMYLHGHYGRSSSLDSSMIVDDGDGRPEGDGSYTRPATSPEGAVYIVAGSSGKTSSAPLDHAAMYVSWLELGSVVVDVEGARMDVSFLDERGTELDWFSIVKP